MANYYLDSSALVKRYVNESGTVWIRNLLDANLNDDIYLVRITGAEIIGALFRKARGGLVSMGEAQRAATTFRTSWQRYFIVEIAEATVEEAMTLAEKHYLRGYDAIHLAAALEVQRTLQATGLSSLTFISADVEQLQAARAEGLLVENPDTYS